MNSLNNVAVTRSQTGEWIHPEIKKYLDENFPAGVADINEDRRKKLENNFGLNIRFEEMYEHAPVETIHEYYQKGVMTNWQPKPPEGDGWLILAITDSEDGAIAWWGKQKEDA